MASRPLRVSRSTGWNAALLKAARNRSVSFSLSSTNRMVGLPFMDLSGPAQFEPEAATLAGNGIDACSSAHAFHALLDDRQTDAGAWVFLALQPREQLEYL